MQLICRPTSEQICNVLSAVVTGLRDVSGAFDVTDTYSADLATSTTAAYIDLSNAVITAVSIVQCLYSAHY